jgi:lipoprotein Spr
MLLIYCISFFTLSLAPSAASAFEIPQEISRVSQSENQVQPLNEVTKRTSILRQYNKWQGTRYRFGGNTHKGIDCSALMQHIFRDIKNVRLPRTTFEQIRKGARVEQKHLKAGDLVFFRLGPTQRHVGVYIGDDKFVHASTRKGVTISTLKNQYWHKRFLTARRVMS